MQRVPQRSSTRGLLLEALRQPERLASLTLSQWDHIIPEARRGGLLARLAAMIESGAGLQAIPEQPRAHLRSAQILAEKHRRDTLYEVDQLTQVLGSLVNRLVLLKGAAYLCADLPPARGRVFNDIDILVPKASLAAVEALLGLSGWRLGDMDPYDEQYYRRWMHQLPPLVHIGRQSAIDVHHTIVPSTARIDLQADTLLTQVVAIPSNENLAMLAPPDMVLHSATHLFNEGEFARGLRDLDDLNQLLRHFACEPTFWEQLSSRAIQLDLVRPLYYALRYTSAMLDTPVPAAILARLDHFAPSAPLRVSMDILFERALRSPHPDCRDRFTGPALWVLYVRAHYLRMPLRLLLPHLIRKAVRPQKEQPLLVP